MCELAVKANNSTLDSFEVWLDQLPLWVNILNSLRES